MRHTFPGKILLFGEYLVLNQGAALALPEPRYYTIWENKEEVDEELLDYLSYLKSVNGLEDYLHFSRMEKHLKTGWKLVSDLPRKKGLGSSASIVAAVYERYKTKNDDEMSMVELQSVFSSMENYMHGKSSGFDPMPIYFNQPVLRKNNQCVLVRNQLHCLDTWEIELFDSSHERKDDNGIKRYMERLSNDGKFAERIETLTKVNNKLVEAVIKNEKRIAENLLKTFSDNQLILFEDWIPESIREEWKIAQEVNNTVFKILGAGGGGYFLRIHFLAEDS